MPDAVPYKFINLAEDVLNDAPAPLDHRQIWSQAQARQLDVRVGTRGKTPWHNVRSAINANIDDFGDQSKFVRVGQHPRRYFLRRRLPEIAEESTSQSAGDAVPTQEFPYREKHLHSLLAYWAYNNGDFFDERKICTKTISHSKSHSKGLREWLHPDMVGVYFPFDDMNQDVVKLSHSLNSSEIVRLFSFELKRAIDRRNYRECFFQAVSNSSWAHEGYLVSAEIAENEELYSELGRLSNAFRIGVIRLDVRDINASTVLFRATERSTLDWDTINKLSDNTDFESFIKGVSTAIGAGKVYAAEYDTVEKDINAYIRETCNVEPVE